MSRPRATITIPSLYDDLERRIRHLAGGAAEVDASRKIVEAALDSGEVHYGINTGFGALAQVRIDGDQLSQRSEEHTSELQSRGHLVCRPLLENKEDETR